MAVSDTAVRAQRVRYLQAMDIQVWAPRAPRVTAADVVAGAVVTPVTEAAEAAEAAEAVEAVEAVEANAAAGAQVRRPDVTHMDWEALRQSVAECRLCPLHSTRTQTVFGVGNHAADWLIIGEAPGKDEDLRGEPFVGRAGQLLNAMLRAVGLRREQVYIANILKCRPPNNRDPRPEEVVCCEPYLARQIALVRPRVILALGRIAAQNLLNTDTPIGKLRGTAHRYGDTDIPVVATYHPAYLLRSPLDKRKAWSDLQLALASLGERKP